MEYLQSLHPGYTAIKAEEENDLTVTNEPPTKRDRWHQKNIVLVLLFMALSLGGVTYWVTENRYRPASRHDKCSSISVRKEWRNLMPHEKQDYIRAVQCLKTLPSKLDLNHTLYDDFPWIHSRVGEYVHNAAPFLAWHRYFVHIYESTLISDCGYQGHMPYWDWSLDYPNITDSPVFSPNDGFGSNGEPSKSKRPIVKGYCVKDGPFKDLEIFYLDEKFYPHCLSRGFVEKEELREHAEFVSPRALIGLMELNDYDTFNLELENSAHLAIPRSIRGDFSLLTAPSDPVFFLHHTQLDRLWWHWQSISSGRKHEYAGLSSQGSLEPAKKSDKLDMGDLAPAMAVSEILDTTSGLLCYGY